MKNETARREIESLDYYLQNHTDDYSEESHTAMMMAVKALDQEPCDNAISRQAVLDAIMANCIWENEYNLTSSRIKKAVESLPPVNPQPKTGHWIRVTDKTGHLVWECVKCGWQQRFSTNFCPYCGAKMVEPQESEG